MHSLRERTPIIIHIFCLTTFSGTWFADAQAVGEKTDCSSVESLWTSSNRQRFSFQKNLVRSFDQHHIICSNVTLFRSFIVGCCNRTHQLELGCQQNRPVMPEEPLWACNKASGNADQTRQFFQSCERWSLCSKIGRFTIRISLLNQVQA